MGGERFSNRMHEYALCTTPYTTVCYSNNVFGKLERLLFFKETSLLGPKFKQDRHVTLRRVRATIAVVEKH